MRRLLKYTIFFLLPCALLLLLLLALSRNPLDITPFIAKQASKLDLGGCRLDFAKVELLFEHGLNIQVKDAALFSNHTHRLTRIDELKIRLHGPSLLQLKIRPAYISAHGAAVSAELGPEGFFVAGQPLGRQSTPGKSAADIISVLNSIHRAESPLGEFISALAGLQLETSQIIFYDRIHSAEWHADKIRVAFSSTDARLRLAIHTNLRRKTEFVPIEIRFTHAAGSDQAQIDAKFTLSGLTMLAGYVPRAVAESLTTKALLKLSTAIGPGNIMAAPEFVVDGKNTTLHLPSVFSADLNFTDVEARGRYSSDKAKSLNIDRLMLKDESGLTITSSANIEVLPAGLTLRLSAELSPTTIDHLERYFPTAAAPPLSLWLSNNLNLARINSAKIEMAGPLREFPWPDEHPDTKFNASFAFEDLEVHYWDRLPPGREVSGDFAMDRGVIIIRGKDAKIGEQNVPHVLVEIADVMRTHTPPSITVNGEATGELANALSTFVQPLAQGAVMPEVAGLQSSHIRVNVPLAAPNTTNYSIASRVEKLKVRLPDPAIDFISDLTTLDITENETVIRGHGNLNEQRVDLTIREQAKGFGQATELEIRGEISPKFCAAFLPENYLALQAPVSGALSVKKKADKLFAYTLQLDAARAPLSVPVFKWQKTAQAPGSLLSRGNFSVADRSINVETLTPSAPQLSINASGQFSLQQPQRSKLNASFTIGNTALHLSHASGKTAISGDKLDFSALALSGKTEKQAEIQLPDLDLAFNVDEVTLNKGRLRDFRGTVRSSNKRLTNVDFSAQTSHKGNVRLLAVSENEVPVLVLTSNDAGALTRVFGIESNIMGGTLRMDLSSPNRQVPALEDAQGQVSLQNVRVTESPLLFQILSVFSLQQWLSPEKGAVFDEIALVYELNGEMLSIKEANFSSPLLTIFLKGKVNITSGELAMTGQAVPLQTAGKLSEMIPLIGKTVSGVQKSLLGAPFTVSGTMEKPKVSFLPNPF